MSGKLDTANTYRKGALLDSDIEAYELAVRVFFGYDKRLPKLFTRYMLVDKVAAITYQPWRKAWGLHSYALKCLLAAKIIKQVGDDEYLCIHKSPQRIATLLRYQAIKIKKMESEFKEVIEYERKLARERYGK